MRPLATAPASSSPSAHAHPVTGVAFDATGRRLLASYSSEGVFCFATKEHGRSHDQLRASLPGSSQPSDAALRRHGCARGAGATTIAATAAPADDEPATSVVPQRPRTTLRARRGASAAAAAERSAAAALASTPGVAAAAAAFQQQPDGTLLTGEPSIEPGTGGAPAMLHLPGFMGGPDMRMPLPQLRNLPPGSVTNVSINIVDSTGTVHSHRFTLPPLPEPAAVGGQRGARGGRGRSARARLTGSGHARGSGARGRPARSGSAGLGGGATAAAAAAAAAPAAAAAAAAPAAAAAAAAAAPAAAAAAAAAAVTASGSGTGGSGTGVGALNSGATPSTDEGEGRGSDDGSDRVAQTAMLGSSYANGYASGMLRGMQDALSHFLYQTFRGGPASAAPLPSQQAAPIATQQLQLPQQEQGSPYVPSPLQPGTMRLGPGGEQQRRRARLFGGQIANIGSRGDISSGGGTRRGVFGAGLSLAGAGSGAGGAPAAPGASAGSRFYPLASVSLPLVGFGQSSGGGGSGSGASRSGLSAGLSSLLSALRRSPEEAGPRRGAGVFMFGRGEQAGTAAAHGEEARRRMTGAPVASAAAETGAGTTLLRDAGEAHVPSGRPRLPTPRPGSADRSGGCGGNGDAAPGEERPTKRLRMRSATPPIPVPLRVLRPRHRPPPSASTQDEEEQPHEEDQQKKEEQEHKSSSSAGIDESQGPRSRGKTAVHAAPRASARRGGGGGGGGDDDDDAGPSCSGPTKASGDEGAGDVRRITRHTLATARAQARRLRLGVGRPGPGDEGDAEEDEADDDHHHLAATTGPGVRSRARGSASSSAQTRRGQLQQQQQQQQQRRRRRRQQPGIPGGDSEDTGTDEDGAGPVPSMRACSRLAVPQARRGQAAAGGRVADAGDTAGPPVTLRRVTRARAAQTASGPAPPTTAAGGRTATRHASSQRCADKRVAPSGPRKRQADAQDAPAPAPGLPQALGGGDGSSSEPGSEGEGAGDSLGAPPPRRFPIQAVPASDSDASEGLTSSDQQSEGDWDALLLAGGGRAATARAAQMAADGEDRSGSGGGLGPRGGGYLFACRGHRNQVTLKNVGWLGGGRSAGDARGAFVVSGSDDGCVFVWSGADGRLINVLEGGDRPINCVKAHPFNPVLASCGMDPIVRLWSPGAAPPTDLAHARGIMEGNAAAAVAVDALAHARGHMGGGMQLDALLGQGLAMAFDMLSGMLAGSGGGSGNDVGGGRNVGNRSRGRNGRGAARR
jgi:hypothetical protein